MEDKDIQTIATDCAYEILFNLDQGYELDDTSARKEVLNIMIDNGKLKQKIVDILAKDLENVVIWVENQVHQIASGQKRLADGQRFIAGFKQKKD